MVNDLTDLSIVFLHGLNGNPGSTWKHASTGFFWPWELRHHVRDSRIMLFGYDADIAPQLGTNLIRIRGLAEGLLSSLVNKRQEDNEANRSLIFVAHSLGGLIVKKALVLASQAVNTEADDAHLIYKSTKGLIFLGTPHSGSAVDKKKRVWMLKKIAKAAFTEVPPKLESALELHSDELGDLADDFRKITLWTERQLTIYTYYETFSTAAIGEPVVDETSARLGYDKETAQPIQADHENMVKYRDENDADFENLCGKIKILRRKAVRTISEASKPKDENRWTGNKYYEIPRTASALFTGRQEIYNKLKAACSPVDPMTTQLTQKRYVLYGLGGSGKTQLCLKFAEEYRESFWGIFWVDMSSDKRIRQSFSDIAKACAVTDDFKTVMRWLSNCSEPWLLVMDNADDPQLKVSEYFPTGNRGTILLTTRNPGNTLHGTVGSCLIDKMETEEAISLIIKITSEGNVPDKNLRDTARPVVLLLGCLALAIVQAGSAIRQGLCTMAEYCLLFSQRRHELLNHSLGQAGEDYKHTVYTTWEVSLRMIMAMSELEATDAIELLNVFGFLHYEGISEEIFQQAWKNLRTKERSKWMRSRQIRLVRFQKDEAADTPPKRKAFLGFQSVFTTPRVRMREGPESAETSMHALRKALSLLSSFSLISRDRDGLISLHPLVHNWIRIRLSKERQEFFWILAISTITTAISRKYEVFDYQLRRSLLPHIDHCLKFHEDGIFHLLNVGQDCLRMAEKISVAYAENGRAQEGLQLLEKIVELKRSTLGEEHPDTLSLMHDLALVYKDAGQPKKALELAEKLVEIDKRTRGEEHPDTLVSMHSITLRYGEAGRQQEELELLEKVVEVRKRTLGEEHLDTLNLMHDLALRYGEVGRQQEEQELLEKVLEVSKRTQGEEHPDTLISMHNLALRYGRVGRQQEELELLEKVVEGSKRTRGEEHPKTLSSMHNLALTFGEIGRQQEAVELLAKVVGVRERTLGEEHRDTLNSMHSLAVRYQKVGRQQEALELMEKGVEVSKRTRGEKHPDTLKSMNDLALMRGS